MTDRPPRLSQDEFDLIVAHAVERIPRDIRRHLDNIAITVQRRPSRTLLREMHVPRGDTLYGIFEGDALTERSASEPPLYPDRIIIFQEPLENDCDTIDERTREIERTVVHEIAHYFGIEEERLAELGYE